MFFIDLDRFEDRTAFITDGTSLSYNDLEQKVLSFCKLLPQKKQLIAIEMHRDIEDIVAYLACLRMNHTVLMVDPQRTPEQKASIYKIYNPNYIFSNHTLQSFSPQTHNLYEKLALMLPTSGTTGSSKYVRLSRDNIQTNCNSILGYLPLDQNDIAISLLPLYYSYGLSILHTHLQVGASMLLSEYSLLQKEFWHLFATFGITNLNAVPYHYEILKKLRFQSKKYPKLRFLTQAGGKLHVDLVKHFATDAKENEKLFFVMYGQTEATARISYLPPQMVLKKPSSIGIAIPGTTLKTNKTSPSELIFYGKNVMLGYAQSKEDLTKGDELKGVLHTGDIGYKDEDGYFYITGRAKRFIKLFGERVNLDEIEQRLKKTVKDLAITAKDDALFIWMIQDHTQEVSDILKKEYGMHHSAFTCKLINELFYTPNGKIDYKRFEELL